MAVEYRAKALGGVHEYSILGNTLSAASSGMPGMTHDFSLDGTGVALIPKKKFGRLFWAGVAAFVVPLWTLTVTYLKSGALDAGGIWPFCHLGFMLVGLAPMLKYRRGVRALFVTRDRKTGIMVFCEHGSEDKYQAFCEQLRATVRPASAPDNASE